MGGRVLGARSECAWTSSRIASHHSIVVELLATRVTVLRRENPRESAVGWRGQLSEREKREKEGTNGNRRRLNVDDERVPLSGGDYASRV